LQLDLLALNRPDNLQARALRNMSSDSHLGSKLGRQATKPFASGGSECTP